MLSNVIPNQLRSFVALARKREISAPPIHWSSVKGRNMWVASTPGASMVLDHMYHMIFVRQSFVSLGCTPLKRCIPYMRLFARSCRMLMRSLPCQMPRRGHIARLGSPVKNPTVPSRSLVSNSVGKSIGGLAKEDLDCIPSLCSFTLLELTSSSYLVVVCNREVQRRCVVDLKTSEKICKRKVNPLGWIVHIDVWE